MFFKILHRPMEKLRPISCSWKRNSIDLSNIHLSTGASCVDVISYQTRWSRAHANSSAKFSLRPNLSFSASLVLWRRATLCRPLHLLLSILTWSAKYSSLKTDAAKNGSNVVWQDSYNHSNGRNKKRTFAFVWTPVVENPTFATESEVLFLRYWPWY